MPSSAAEYILLGVIIVTFCMLLFYLVRGTLPFGLMRYFTKKPIGPTTPTSHTTPPLVPPASPPDQHPTDQPAQHPAEQPPAQPARPLYTYAVQGGPQWDAGNAFEYTCPTAPGVSTALSTNEWCIFNDQTSAENWCSSDDACIGYVQGTGSGGANMYQLTKRVKPDPHSPNHLFYAKTKK